MKWKEKKLSQGSSEFKNIFNGSMLVPPFRFND